MVPKLSKGAGIKGTALYVLHDVRDENERATGVELTPEQQTQHRVGMTSTRNLSTDDPELAWRLMCVTAASRDELKQAAGIKPGGRQTKNFCGHLSLSWEHETKPDRAEMLRATEGALTALGWQDLQALIVEHRDHDHAHCHIVVNLIHPETGRTAPNAKNDYEKLQRWAHEYDKARGIEACPNRAERMERAPDEPTPSEPAKRWLSRKEYEAIRATERADHRAQALDRYRTAAAEVREQFRPEWAALYKEQRAEQRGFDRDVARRFRDLDQATHPDQVIAFYNKHREQIWRGIEPGQQPGNNHTLLTPGFMRKALERADRVDRFVLTERHDMEKADLQARHTEARQDAYRAAWQRPKPAEPAAAAPADAGRSRTGIAAALAIGAAGAAGVAAYALKQSRQADRDPQRDLDRAAERISRQGRAANANRQSEPTHAMEPKHGGGGGGGGSAKPDHDELAALRARIERERKAALARHDPFFDIGRERTRSRD